MIEIATTSVKFESPSGDCPRELEQDLAELTKILEYHARQIVQKYSGMVYSIDEGF